MIDLTGYQGALEHLPQGIARAEVNAERIRCTDIAIRDGRAASSVSFDQTKFYIRAGGERLGTVYTERPDDDAAALFCAAAENARWTDAGDTPMNGPERSVSDSDEGENEPIKSMIVLGAEAEKAMRGADIPFLHVRVTERELRTVNSLGLDSFTHRHWADLYTTVSLPRVGMQAAEAEANVSACGLDQLDPAAFAQKALALADQTDGGGLKPITLSSGSYDCVMTGQVLRNILMTAWRSLSAEAMQGGGSAFRAVGEKIGSVEVNLINAPVHPLSGKRFPVDSEGTPMGETLLVEQGLLREPLTTLSSARKAGIASNGCTGRIPVMTGNVPIALTTVPGLIYLRPDGRNTQRQLIERMDTGFVLTYSLDLFHSVNIASGLFSVPCGGYFVRHGEPVGSVSQMTVAGSLRELFTAVEAVGNDLDFDDFYFRNYCVGSPSALLRNMTFSS